ncbi:helix-turn-helix transcriptional regulator [Microtetraspora malaysiensis]|uniref:Helix-turn-helix transcriptional regulator n=1 Tax=Microtetraspora malaysiensis TaxID=161358 RepID=A0ABW6SK83_9ACTN
MNRPQSLKAVPAARPADDKLLFLDEVAERTRYDEGTLRYLRHVGGDMAPPLWKRGRRLVAWRSEIDTWLDAQRAQDERAPQRVR